MAFQVRMKINTNSVKILTVATTKEEFDKITIKELKKKALAFFPGTTDLSSLRVMFGGTDLDDDKTLVFYKIGHLTLLIVVRQGLCSHFATPDELKNYCKVQLERGGTEFKCPTCARKWSYDEVREFAKLTAEDQLYFEETVGVNTAKKLSEIKHCPGCDAFIERRNSSSLCIQCTFCTVMTRRVYEFCWQCLREWKGRHSRADRCDNVGCSSRSGHFSLLKSMWPN